MLSINKEIDNTIQTLYKNLKQRNSSDHIHLELNEIFNDKAANACISVYLNERPAHKILEDLIKWAKEEGLQDVISKVDELKG